MRQPIPLRRTPFRRAFTLMELVVSTGMISLVIGSLASVVVLASRALPTSSSATGAAAAAARATDRLTTELRFATRITHAGPSRIVFTVPDCTGDALEDTVEYSISGVGGPLRRSVNGGKAVELLPSTRGFLLDYTYHKHVESRTVNTVENSNEVLLSSFTGWSGVSHSWGMARLNLLSAVAERFVVDKIKIPDDATSWRITRVSVRLRKAGLLGSSVSVAIHPPASAGGSIPALLPYGSATIIPTSSLSSSPSWQDAAFSDVVFGDPSLREFIIVLKPALSTDDAYVEYYTSSSAPVDEYVYRYTTDGLLWQPTSNLHRADVPFFVYGRYERNISTVQNVDTYSVSRVGITLQADGSTRSRIVSGVHLANVPEAPPP